MATYTSFSELKDKQLKLGDEVQFTIKGEKLFYIVNKSFLEELVYTSNAVIFEKLKISDKNRYASLIYGYIVVSGKGEYSWPEFRENDYKAATKLVCNLFKKCEEVVKDSLYKKGDKVRVKDQYDPGCSGYDYPSTFTEEMLRNYGGKEVTITQVLPTTKFNARRLYIEEYEYKIEEDKGLYFWSAAMFSGKVNKTTSTEEELYEVGDFVKIKEQDDPDHIPGFVNEMAKMYGGSWCKIRRIVPSGWFTLETLGGNEIGYRWSKAMFSEHKKNLPKEISKFSSFSFTEKDIPKNCPYHPYVIDQALIELSKGIHEGVKDPKEAFKKCIYKSVGYWFSWEKTSQGWDYWNNIFKNSSFIPSCYIPTYFIEELPVDTEELVEYCKKDISDAIVQCSSRTSHNSMEIPCSYEEVTLSIKKKKVHF